MSALTWKEIRSQRSGGRLKHHEHPVHQLAAEAQRRFEEQRLDQTFDPEQMFRFRVDSTARLWGLLTDHVFHVLWWDDGHHVYPVGKRHT